MPATSGRVRMPHNNRMSTSGALKTSEIWSKTIGHDPYAGSDEKQEEKSAADEEKARGLMELARHQNVAGDASRDDFARKMYLGLKPGKKRRSQESAAPNTNATMQLLEQDSSSSEDELVVEADNKAEVKKLTDFRGMERRSKKDRKRKDHKKRKKRYSSSSSSDDSDDDSSSSDDSFQRRRRKSKKKDKRKKKHRHRKRSEALIDEESDASLSSSSDKRRKRRRTSHHRRSLKNWNLEEKADTAADNGEGKQRL